MFFLAAFSMQPDCSLPRKQSDVVSGILKSLFLQLLASIPSGPCCNDCSSYCGKLLPCYRFKSRQEDQLIVLRKIYSVVWA